MIGIADFETINNERVIKREGKTRIWAYGICEVGNPENFLYGNSMENFFQYCFKSYKENHTFYFHNLKFDGSFIIDYLLRNDYKLIYDKKDIKDKTFTTLISDMNQFYKIEVYFKKNKSHTNKVTFLDSQKLLNFKVEKIAKDFDLPIRKLKIGVYSPHGPIKIIKQKKLSFKNLKKSEDDIFYYFERPKRKYKVTVYKKIFIKDLSKINRIRKKYQINLLDLGYNGYRKIGHTLTKNELDYLRNDCEVMSRALQIMFDINLTRMTIGSNALEEYKNTIGKKSFDRHFPETEIGEDAGIRKSYRGGFTYLNPKYAGYVIKNGIVLDVNSLYPSVMYYERLPYGKPIFYDGKYIPDKLYPLYIQVIECQFELKKDKIPTIQIKGDLAFEPTKYLTSSLNDIDIDEPVTLILTNVDLELFLENYEVYNLEYHCGYKYKASNKLFKKYIDKWMGVKIESEKTGNHAMRQIAKLMLNSLYGKFATNPIVQSKTPFYDENKDIVRYKLEDKEIRKGVYIALASFVTSYARAKTIRSAQKVYDRFIYADTDSLHLEGLEIPKELEIHSSKLGAWKHEFTFDEGKYLRQKSYMEYGKDPHKDEPKYTKIVCAGMTEQSYKYVNFENFKIGASFKGKLQRKTVPGGTYLKHTTFTIKSHSYY